MSDDHTWYTVPEIADLPWINVRVDAVRKWIRTGKLQARRTPGGQYRVREDWLEEAVETVNGIN